VPTVKDGDLVMWESNTICRYLCSTRNGERLYPKDPAARTHVERWMELATLQCRPADGARLLFGLIRTRPRTARWLPAGRSGGAARRWPPGRLRMTRLEGSSYLVGDELTLAEITLGTLAYRWHAFSDRAAAASKNLKGWFRPAA